MEKGEGRLRYRDEDAWEAVYEELAEAMAKLESALKPHLKRL